MRKQIIILALILASIYAILSVLGWGSEYDAEKLYYSAMRTSGKISSNPDVAPPGMVASVENTLRRLLDRYPKTNTARIAHITLAEFNVLNKKYDKAISVLDEAIAKYKEDATLLSQAHFLKGACYQRMENPDKSVAEFKTVRDNYPNTQLGMLAPLYIARHYDALGDADNSRNSYNDAAEHYRKVSGENPKTALGYAASNLLIQTYVDSGNYDEAAGAIEETIAAYPAPMTYSRLIPLVEALYVKKLNRPEKAAAMYKNIKAGVLDKKLADFLQTKIDKLEGKSEPR